MNFFVAFLVVVVVAKKHLQQMLRIWRKRSRVRDMASEFGEKNFIVKCSAN